MTALDVVSLDRAPLKDAVMLGCVVTDVQGDLGQPVVIVERR